MRLRTLVALGFAGLALSSAPELMDAQGQGKGKAQGQGQGQGQGKGGGKSAGKSQAQGNDKQDKGARGLEARESKQRGRSGIARTNQGRGRSAEVQASRGSGRSALARGNVRRFGRLVSVNDLRPPVRRLALSGRPAQVVLAGALARAHLRGIDDDLLIVPVANRLDLRNRNGDLLLFMDDNRARDIGSWRVGVLQPGVRAGAPSFCRSGEGHPVWGRQWCLDKGFGLAEFNDFQWARTDAVRDLVFLQPVTPATLAGNALMGLLGDRAFDRLALHAVTLGLAQPLIGRWVPEPAGPRVLLVSSGVAPVAEIVDVNRDGRADMLLMAVRPWQ